MKAFVSSIALAVTMLIFFGCSGPSKNTSSQGNGVAGTGTVIVPTAVAKSFQKELAGTWNVISMRRQQKAELETLSGVTLKFDENDVKFSGKAPCNSISGTIQLNGYSIRFLNIVSTKMACEHLEVETAFLNLLQTRISAFTVDGNKLYLRDGISNIVFECDKVLEGISSPVVDKSSDFALIITAHI